MRTAHITAFASAVAGRRHAADEAIARRRAEHEAARAALAHTDATIRACRRELERLEGFRAIGAEHVQELEVELDRMRQYREGCDTVLLDAAATPAPAADPAPSPQVFDRSGGEGWGGGRAPAKHDAAGPVTRHLRRNGAG